MNDEFCPQAIKHNGQILWDSTYSYRSSEKHVESSYVVAVTILAVLDSAQLAGLFHKWTKGWSMNKAKVEWMKPE